MTFFLRVEKALIADFATAVRNNRAPQVPGREAPNVDRLNDAMAKPASTGAVAEIASVAAG